MGLETNYSTEHGDGNQDGFPVHRDGDQKDSTEPTDGAPDGSPEPTASTSPPKELRDMTPADISGAELRAYCKKLDRAMEEMDKKSPGNVNTSGIPRGF